MEIAYKKRTVFNYEMHLKVVLNFSEDRLKIVLKDNITKIVVLLNIILVILFYVVTDKEK